MVRRAMAYGPSIPRDATGRPTWPAAATDDVGLLFLCAQNASRSQMAMGFFHRLVGDRALVDEVAARLLEASAPEAPDCVARTGGAGKRGGERPQKPVALGVVPIVPCSSS